MKNTMMSNMSTIVGLLLMVTVASAMDIWNLQQLDDAKRRGEKNIVIRNILVPAGAQLNLENLQPGTHVKFAGQVKFGYKEWDGPLIKIGGNNIRIEGLAGNVIDAQGHRWWDGQGIKGGKKKPNFMQLYRLYNSHVSGMFLKDTPLKTVLVDFCDNVEISYMNLDSSRGKGSAFNTDGFCVGINKNIRIHNTRVHNQDDCLCVLASENVSFEYSTCIGGNGVSIGSMGDGYTVRGLTVRTVQIIDSFNGLRIKTKKNHNALVENVTWDGVELRDIQQRGIIIHGNYPNWRPTDEPDNRIPIKNLVINNVFGTVQRGGSNVWVWVGPNVASNWKVSNIRITGGGLKLACKGIPRGVNMPCGY